MVKPIKYVRLRLSDLKYLRALEKEYGKNTSETIKTVLYILADQIKKGERQWEDLERKEAAQN